IVVYCTYPVKKIVGELKVKSVVIKSTLFLARIRLYSYLLILLKIFSTYSGFIDNKILHIFIFPL
ncbi:hypothetical protein, partial [Candidatus Endomicrobiellum pyrsonymphae]|uniref:hypothetical protein n=1 Tax=Candidatus Endomicrobiellum pyrsonymphae TaxID=1408203 RepID=UPI0035A90046